MPPTKKHLGSLLSPRCFFMSKIILHTHTFVAQNFYLLALKSHFRCQTALKCPKIGTCKCFKSRHSHQFENRRKMAVFPYFTVLCALSIFQNLQRKLAKIKRKSSHFVALFHDFVALLSHFCTPKKAWIRSRPLFY